MDLRRLFGGPAIALRQACYPPDAALVRHRIFSRIHAGCAFLSTPGLARRAVSALNSYDTPSHPFSERPYVWPLQMVHHQASKRRHRREAWRYFHKAQPRNHPGGESRAAADPGMNFKLRLAVQRARAQNMPNDNIERAISKGTGVGFR